jgi:hypothetical protein
MKYEPLYFDRAPVIPEGKTNFYIPKKEFYIYNYYKVPIDVSVITKTKIVKLATNISSGKRSNNITKNLVDNIVDGTEIIIEASNNKIILGKTVMTVPPGETIRNLHCGMVSAHDDFSDSSDIVKSPLGTAMSKVRLVNLTPRVLSLTTTGSNALLIPPFKSLLYYGQYENGVQMGVTFRDIDGFLPNYTLEIPVTDIFMGVISDISIPLYRGAKLGGAYFDDPGEIYRPLELIPTQSHRGMYIDPFYIPNSW